MRASTVLHEIVLVYDADCPNAEAARRNLFQAIATTGKAGQWKEIDRRDPNSPAEYRRFGSPTVLIDGQDVAGCEIEVVKGAAPGAGGDQNPRCRCGKEMEKIRG